MYLLRKVSDKLRTAAGSSGIVLAVLNVVQAREMLNLEVDGNHDFFVGEGEWLVHNEEVGPNCFTWIGIKISSEVRKTIATKISGGHANVKHANIFTGAIGQEEKAVIVQNIMEQAINKNRFLRYSDGRTSFWNGSDTVIHFDPNSADMGTIFQTPSGKGSAYWKSLFAHNNAMPGAK